MTIRSLVKQKNITIENYAIFYRILPRIIISDLDTFPFISFITKIIVVTVLTPIKIIKSMRVQIHITTGKCFRNRLEVKWNKSVFIQFRQLFIAHVLWFAKQKLL